MVPGLPEVSGGSGGSGGSGANEFAGQTRSDRLPVAELAGIFSPAFIRWRPDARTSLFSRQVICLVFAGCFVSRHSLNVLRPDCIAMREGHDEPRIESLDKDSRNNKETQHVQSKKNDTRISPSEDGKGVLDGCNDRYQSCLLQLPRRLRM